MKRNQNLKEFYKLGNYKPTKNALPVMYKGTQYLSKAQCIYLENITRKELEEYLTRQEEVYEEPDFMEDENPYMKL